MSGKYQTPESKKDEYRKYLERTGVTDALTKVLVSLYEETERPTNAIEYIKLYLAVQNDQKNSDQDVLKTENDDLKRKVKDLEKEIDELNARLRSLNKNSVLK